jgi:hypothetical protein
LASCGRHEKATGLGFVDEHVDWDARKTRRYGSDAAQKGAAGGDESPAAPVC